MKTFYIKIRTDGEEGSGTKTDPFNGDELGFDIAIQKIKNITYVNPDEPITIRIQDGEYWTKGVALGKNWTILGSGMDSTFIRLLDVGNTSFHHPNVQVMSSSWYGGTEPVWLTYLKVSSLTLDAQWFNQSDRKTPTVKYSGLYAQVTKALIQKVKVINYGSNGVILEHAEAFPLFIETYNDENTQIIIQDCIVEDQHRLAGEGLKSGYSNCIMVQTTQDGKGDRIPFGTRVSTSAIIRRNKVIGVYGSAYGCAHSENVVFENNKAYGCLGSFNSDTGKNKKIKFVNNIFYNCNQGINMGNHWSGGPFTEIEIVGNKFYLTDPYLNKFTDKPTIFYSFGVRLGGNTNGVKIIGNTFKSLYGLKGLNEKLYAIGQSFPSDTNMIQESNVFTNIKDMVITNAPFYEYQSQT